MNDNDKFQQQILFDEPTVKVSGDDTQALTEQVVVDNDDWQQIEESDDELFATQPPSKGSGWKWQIITLILAVVIGMELVDFFNTGFADSPILTSLYGLLLLLIATLAGSSLIKELSGLKQLKQREQLRTQLELLSEGGGNGKAGALLAKVTKGLATDLSSEQQESWQQTMAQDHSDNELLTLYSRQILSETDQKALAEVARFSSESVVLVALSPVALLDMLIMLWRNLTLVDKVAGLYGLKLGYWSRIKLVKQVIVNVIYAGASEVIADISVDMLGADLLGKLSGRLAQGLGAGMLTARLGLKTIYMCRPIPFDENAPKLSQVRKEVITQIKQLAMK